jgi:hypothetical protein
MKKLIVLSLILIAFTLKSAATDSTGVSLSGASKSAGINSIDLITGYGVATTISSISVQNNNPEIATITSIAFNCNTNTGIKATPVTNGNGTATVTCHVNYTDPGDGLPKSEDKIIVISYTVTGSPHGIKLSLSFN